MTISYEESRFLKRSWPVPLILAVSVTTFVAGTPVTASGGSPSQEGVIVYSRWFEAGGDSALCVTDPRGSRTAILRVFDDQQAGFPVWSPDGKQIAFVLNYEIHVLDADGSNQTVVTSGIHPSWSPDGSQLAFEYDGEIRVIELDGGAQRSLGAGRNPDWSPEGDRIVFDQIPDPFLTDGPEGELKSTDPQGEDLRDLGYGQDAAWSPDGTEIAFTDHTYWSSLIRVVNADGDGHRSVTEEVYGQPRPGLPAWSPDGEQVLFSLGQALWTANADGTMRHRVLRSGGTADWSLAPDLPDLWGRRSCDDPKRFVSLNLDGHLFAHGKVWTNNRARCSIEGITVTVWKKTKKGLRLAATAESNADGFYAKEMKLYTTEGRNPDRPGRYQAQLNGPDSSDCKRSRSAWKVHEH
jgi:hypothetical protein